MPIIVLDVQRPLCQAPEHQEGKGYNPPHEGQRASDSNPHEPEWQEEQPHDGIKHERDEG
jgi:hypothetical protein